MISMMARIFRAVFHGTNYKLAPAMINDQHDGADFPCCVSWHQLQIGASYN